MMVEEIYMEDGRRWDFLSFKGDFYIPEHDIVMEDCKEARIIAEEMKLERKKKAYEETLQYYSQEAELVDAKSIGS